MSIQEELKAFLLEKGVADVGFFKLDDGEELYTTEELKNLPVGMTVYAVWSDTLD